MRPTILLAGVVALLVGAGAAKDNGAREVEKSLRALNAAFAKNDSAAMRPNSPSAATVSGSSAMGSSRVCHRSEPLR